MGAVLALWENLTGAVIPYAGTTAPNGFLLCAGQVVNRADYPNLFGVIGTTYATGGETATQFRLPDLRGRVPAGKDNMGGTAASRLTTANGLDGATLGAAGGAQTHTLTTGQMPAHNHGVIDPGHAHAVTDPGHAHSVSDPGHAHGVNDPGHTHNYDRITVSQPNGTGVSNTTSTTTNAARATTASGTGISIAASGTGVGVVAAVTGVGVQAAGTGITTQNNGSGQAHNNTQPTVVLNYIIKT